MTKNALTEHVMTKNVNDARSRSGHPHLPCLCCACSPDVPTNELLTPKLTNSDSGQKTPKRSRASQPPLQRRHDTPRTTRRNPLSDISTIAMQRSAPLHGGTLYQREMIRRSSPSSTVPTQSLPSPRSADRGVAPANTHTDAAADAEQDENEPTIAKRLRYSDEARLLPAPVEAAPPASHAAHVIVEESEEDCDWLSSPEPELSDLIP